MFCQGKQSVLHNETKCLVKGNSLFYLAKHAPVPYKGRTSTISHSCKNKGSPQENLRRSFVIATGFKPVTGWSVVSYSIQLSYAASLFNGCKDTYFFRISKQYTNFFWRNLFDKAIIKQLPADCHPHIPLPSRWAIMIYICRDISKRQLTYNRNFS